MMFMSGKLGGISTVSNLGHINGGHIKSGGRAAREVLTRNTSDDASALTTRGWFTIERSQFPIFEILSLSMYFSELFVRPSVS